MRNELYFATFTEIGHHSSVYVNEYANKEKLVSDAIMSLCWLVLSTHTSEKKNDAIYTL